MDIHGHYFPGVNSVKLLYLESSVYGLFVSVFNCVRDSKRDTKQKQKTKKTLGHEESASS